MTQQLQPPSRPEQSASFQPAPAAQVGPAPTGRSPGSLGFSGDRRSLRVAAALLIVGEAVYAVATPLHPADRDPISEFVMYAGSQSWATVHSVQFASSIIVAFGLLALIQGLNANSGISGLVNRFAAASAVVGIALNGAVYAVDGVALKQAADTWVNGPPATQSALFAAVEAVRGMEWGLRSYAAYTTGLTLILIAVVIVSTARVPQVIGHLVGLTGLVYLALGVGYGSLYTALSDHAMVGNVSYYLLVLVWIWAIWLLVIAWRMKESDAEAIR